MPKTGPMRLSGARRTLAGLFVAAGVAFGAAVVPAHADVGVYVPVVHDGDLRSYRLYVPRSLPADRAAPLLVVLHGLKGSAEATANLTRFDVLAERYGFVAVYPEGKDQSWNAGPCCGASAGTDVDDVGFLAEVVSEVSLAVNVDRARVYAAGFSNGGMMALRTACERPDLFAAVASVAGTLLTPCVPDRPVSVLQVSGSKDALVPYRGTAFSGVLRTMLPAVPIGAGAWERADGCSGLPSLLRTASVETRTYDRCRGGASVRTVRVTAAGHVWPTEARDRYEAGEQVWRFLSSHATRPVVGTSEPVLTTRVLAARVRGAVEGRVDGRFDVVIGRRVVVDVRRGTRWVRAGAGRTDVEGRFRVAAPAGLLRVRYADGPGLASETFVR